MTIDLFKLKALATAAAANPYDSVALNEYGTAVPPATVLGLITEIERHRQVNAEGCQPESNIRPLGIACAGVKTCRSLDKAEGGTPDNNIHPGNMAGINDVLPTVAVEGDQLVIRITTECLLHAITCNSQWPVDATGEPIRIENGALLVQEIILELQREDEQGTNPMHHLLDNAVLGALDNGSEAVNYDEVNG